MGAANKVPGVSGGLVAFVAGFYEEFIYSLQKVNANQPVESLMVVDLPLVFTESMPLSHAASLAYI